MSEGAVHAIIWAMCIALPLAALFVILATGGDVFVSFAAGMVTTLLLIWVAFRRSVKPTRFPEPEGDAVSKTVPPTFTGGAV